MIQPKFHSKSEVAQALKDSTNRKNAEPVIEDLVVAAFVKGPDGELIPVPFSKARVANDYAERIKPKVSDDAVLAKTKKGYSNCMDNVVGDYIQGGIVDVLRNDRTHRASWHIFRKSPLKRLVSDTLPERPDLQSITPPHTMSATTPGAPPKRTIGALVVATVLFIGAAVNYGNESLKLIETFKGLINTPQETPEDKR